MAQKAAHSRRHKMKYRPVDVAQEVRTDVTHHTPISDTERALFAVCFGSLIDQILAEPD